MPTPINALAGRAAALREFDLLPDDLLIGFTELALLDGRSESALRQAKHVGKLPLRAIPHSGRRVRFRLGDVRAYLRGEEAA